ARGVLFILVLSLFFAYLLEPAVTLLQRHSRLARGRRSWAIAQVYVIAAVFAGCFAYALGPHLAAPMKSLNAALPIILQGLSSGKAAATLGERHGLSAPQQQWIQDWLARHHDLIARGFERGASSISYAASSAIWVFTIPILAVFLLGDGR